MKVYVNSLEKGKRELSSVKYREGIEIILSDHYFITDSKTNLGLYSSKEYIVKMKDDILVVIPKVFVKELLDAAKSNSSCKVRILGLFAETIGRNFIESYGSWDYSPLEKGEINFLEKGVKNGIAKVGISERGKIVTLLSIAFIQATLLGSMIFVERSEKRKSETLEGEISYINERAKSYEQEFSALEEQRASLLRENMEVDIDKILESDEIWDKLDNALYRNIVYENLVINGNRVDFTGKTDDLMEIYIAEKNLLELGFSKINSDYVKENEGIFSFKIDMELGSRGGA